MSYLLHRYFMVLKEKEKKMRKMYILVRRASFTLGFTQGSPEENFCACELKDMVVKNKIVFLTRLPST